MFQKRRYLLLICVLINVGTTLAYIDPGTGGMIASSVWPIILSIFGAIGIFLTKYFYRPVKKGVVTVWKKIKREKQPE